MMLWARLHASIDCRLHDTTTIHVVDKLVWCIDVAMVAGHTHHLGLSTIPAHSLPISLTHNKFSRSPSLSPKDFGYGKRNHPEIDFESLKVA